MYKLVTGALSLAAILAVASSAPAQPTSPGPAAPPAAGAMAAQPAVHHLVYQFGYNTQAASSGRSTGTTTIDLVGPAADGGMTVTATDDWWNGAKPRQSYTCEVYPNGGVTCAKPPFALSPIQAVIVPLLGRKYFAALSGSSSASWTQHYNVRATFFPSASGGFAGQVYTWNCTVGLTGKGPLSQGSRLLVVEVKGAMTQQGGRRITANETANLAFDPHIHVPALINSEFTFVPTMSVNKYAVQLKLVKASPQ